MQHESVAYQTISGQATAEIEEKKSRFIAHVAHVETEEEALKDSEDRVDMLAERIRTTISPSIAAGRACSNISGTIIS